MKITFLLAATEKQKIGCNNCEWTRAIKTTAKKKTFFTWSSRVSSSKFNPQWRVTQDSRFFHGFLFEKTTLRTMRKENAFFAFLKNIDFHKLKIKGHCAFVSTLLNMISRNKNRHHFSSCHSLYFTEEEFKIPLAPERKEWLCFLIMDLLFE